MKRDGRPVNGTVQTPAQHPWRPPGRSPLHFLHKHRQCRPVRRTFEQACVLDGKRTAASFAPCETSGANTPKRCTKTAGFKISMSPRGVLIINRSLSFGFPRRQSWKKTCVGCRLLCDQHNAGDGLRCVGMGLKCRIPEILRMVLEAREKPNIGRARIRRECKRKRYLDRAAVGAFAFALELVAVQNFQCRPREIRSAVGMLRVLPAPASKIPARALAKSRLKAPNEKCRAVCGTIPLSIRDGQQFDECTRKLNNVILRAPCLG